MTNRLINDMHFDNIWKTIKTDELLCHETQIDDMWKC